jgi:microcompartment protein CcmK/EutM
MNLCRVLGTVVATEKHPAFHARKLLVVQPLDELQQPNGKSFIAIDHSSSAGKGDLVLVMREGNGVRQIVGDKLAPIRSAIVGVVDQIDLGGAGAPPKKKR